MNKSFTAKKLLTQPYPAVVVFLSVCFILPRYSSIAVMLSCAGILSAYVAVLPEAFRSRTGSLMAASCLVVAMWVSAAVITVLTLTGQIQG